MNYTVAINGKTYDLPPCNDEMNKLIFRMNELDDLVHSREISIVTADRERYDFVSRCVPDVLPTFEEVDMNELAVYCYAIIRAYNEPIIRARTDEAVEMLRGVLNRPEINKLLLLVEAAQKKKK